jgi:hypothetical protein
MFLPRQKLGIRSHQTASQAEHNKIKYSATIMQQVIDTETELSKELQSSLSRAIGEANEAIFLGQFQSRVNPVVQGMGVASQQIIESGNRVLQQLDSSEMRELGERLNREQRLDMNELRESAAESLQSIEDVFQMGIIFTSDIGVRVINIFRGTTINAELDALRTSVEVYFKRFRNAIKNLLSIFAKQFRILLRLLADAANRSPAGELRARFLTELHLLEDEFVRFNDYTIALDYNNACVMMSSIESRTLRLQGMCASGNGNASGGGGSGGEGSGGGGSGGEGSGGEGSGGEGSGGEGSGGVGSGGVGSGGEGNSGGGSGGGGSGGEGSGGGGNRGSGPSGMPNGGRTWWAWMLEMIIKGALLDGDAGKYVMLLTTLARTLGYLVRVMSAISSWQSTILALLGFVAICAALWNTAKVH